VKDLIAASRTSRVAALRISIERTAQSSEIHSISSDAEAARERNNNGISPGRAQTFLFMQLSPLCSPLKPPPSVLMAGCDKRLLNGKKIVYVHLCALHFNTRTGKKSALSERRAKTKKYFALFLFMLEYECLLA
jgi:hypothetical protein